MTKEQALRLKRDDKVIPKQGECRGKVLTICDADKMMGEPHFRLSDRITYHYTALELPGEYHE